jgi:hypothetical protein
MEPEPKTPLPWEEKAAIGCLGAMTLQEIHEGFLYFMGATAPGFHGTSPAFVILIVVFVSVGWGLYERSRIAWWVGVGSFLAIGLTDAAMTGATVYETLRHKIGTCEDASWDGGTHLNDFSFFWLGTRNVLLFAVPMLLILGALRKSLRKA